MVGFQPKLVRYFVSKKRLSEICCSGSVAIFEIRYVQARSHWGKFECFCVPEIVLCREKFVLNI